LKLFKDIYRNRSVLVTGSTGFKGSWLTLWLDKLGAKVHGYALEPDTEPSHFKILSLKHGQTFGDIRDHSHLDEVLRLTSPEIVFHLAAQPIVRKSFSDPLTTFETNVMGTVNVLESCRKCPKVRAVIHVSSDKCYENREWIWKYRENDRLGGHDPYSASKACSELVVSSYVKSFFPLEEYGKSHKILLASARAGNVIGGGDWAQDRLVPDIVKSITKNTSLLIRCPDSIRPWQHVLEPLSGYLMLGGKLLEGMKEFSGAWNFGPSSQGLTVLDILHKFQEHWNISYNISSTQVLESSILGIDSTKANTLLEWMPVLDIDNALDMTVEWFREFSSTSQALSLKQLEEYIELATVKQITWSR